MAFWNSYDMLFLSFIYTVLPFSVCQKISREKNMISHNLDVLILYTYYILGESLLFVPLDLTDINISDFQRHSVPHICL